MKVFCPEHRRGFFAPRQSPIRCENRGHLLGKFDFEGEAKPPYELLWQYCCNCEHFCPIDFDRDGLERCPVCTRRTSTLYLCNRCYTVSFESNTPLQTKNFTITSEGVPQPSCPGCLQTASADLHEHACDEINVSFITALTSCPICGERLDVGPSFPSSVTAYLKRTKAANKLNVTFDYETELFVPVEDGEFVLVSNRDDTSQPIVLPRSPRLSNRRDFYELYQDYYHCTRPVVGELHVLEPAYVEAVENGWKLQASGTLEVVEDQPKKKAQVAVTPLRLAEQKDQEPPDKVTAIAAPMKTSQVPATAEPAAPCPHCGSLIEARYSFCWKCGKPLSSDTKPAIRAKENRTAPQLNILLNPDDEELTVQHEERSPGSAPLSWALADAPTHRSPVLGSVLKLIAVALVGVLLSLAFFLLTRSTSSAASSTTQATTGTAEPDTKPPGSAPVVHDVAAKSEPEPQPSSARPEDELKKLRERRLAAKASDRTEVLKTYVSAERAYPDDYRFPYERAKLAIKAGSDRDSHDEAFAALSLAAGKAIKTGKAPEMLESLLKDSSGDFQKLSHRHREWIQLQEALKSKDPKVLNVRVGL